MCVDATAIRPTPTVAGARERTRSFLDSLRKPAVAPEAAGSVVLVVSELVTNALRHGGGTYTLRLGVHPDLIEVAVDDASSRVPCLRTPDQSGATGGWRMVTRLARTTAVIHRPSGGKTVSAFLAQ
ncbi:ATP-binding protein [Streptomyces sp. NPDC058576]|uniref:ATP-binding protein n=1 Tax=Streptomyces sp. NPDC058576 TaxID=3346547 RepID=UPI003650EB71